ncbi:MAG: SDR family oxidoreductase [Chloroflexota bacterium]|nr:MAG: SDR family oxidoreductase [Chloroflexota bacterium]
MRILVTGASGLLGLNVALEAARGGGQPDGPDGGHTVYGVVNRNDLRTDAFRVIKADLLAPGALERLFDQTQPDWVIHCAALAILDACEADPDLAYRLNAELPANLAAIVARGGARLVHISTDAVFDGVRGSYDESDAPNPLSVYARTKLEGEKAVASADPRAIIARVNLFGWSLYGKRSLGEWFFYNLQAGRQVMGFTDVYFCPLLANHLAHILLQMLQAGLSGLYHVVSGECASKYDYGVAVARRFGLEESLITPVSVMQSSLKAARSPNLTLCTDKLTGALGVSLPTLSAGLDGFYTLYQQGYPQALRAMADRAAGNL